MVRALYPMMGRHVRAEREAEHRDRSGEDGDCREDLVY